MLRTYTGQLGIKTKAKHFKEEKIKQKNEDKTKPHWTPWGCEGHPMEGLSGAHPLSSVITTLRVSLAPAINRLSQLFIVPPNTPVRNVTITFWRRKDAICPRLHSKPEAKTRTKPKRPSSQWSPSTTRQFCFLYGTVSYIFLRKKPKYVMCWNKGRIRRAVTQWSDQTYLTSASGLLSWLLGIQFSIKSLCVLGLLLAHFCFFSFLVDEEGMLPLVALWLRGEEFTTPLTFL